MFNVRSFIGNVLAFLSIAALIWNGFSVGLWRPFELILQFYEELIGLLRFIEPPLKAILQFVSQLLAVDLELHPHWRHSFVLMGLYFGVDVRVDLMRYRRGSAAATIIWGGFIAAASSVASGTAPFNAPNMLPLIFPVAGFVIYEIGRSFLTATFYRSSSMSAKFGASTWWQTFRFYLIGFVVADAFIGVASYLAGSGARQLNIISPSLVGLLVFVALLATYNIVRGLWIAIYGPERDQTWSVRFFRINSTRLGIIIFECMAGAILFILCGAGLKKLFT